MHTLKLERDGGRIREIFSSVITLKVEYLADNIADVEYTQVTDGDEIASGLTLKEGSRMFVINEAGETIDAIYSTQRKPNSD